MLISTVPELNVCLYISITFCAICYNGRVQSLENLVINPLWISGDPQKRLYGANNYTFFIHKYARMLIL